MKKSGHVMSFGFGALCTAALAAGLGLGQPGGSDAALDRTSYAIGHDLAVSTLQRLEIDQVRHDRNSLVRGFRDVMESGSQAFTEDEIFGALMVLERQVNERHARSRMNTDPVFKALAEENLRKGRAFAEKFAADDRTRSLPGGVLYRVKGEGAGDTPRPDSVVHVKFESRLIDGTLVGDFADYTARVDSMIDGARATLGRMRVGDVWIVLLPPEAAFGIGGRPPEIGPNQTILAEVTLLGID
ncbi:MAG: FKBP-type peptidyl-prolyl cis-trans isomerase N-terminal domain-containing protein [Planctomycetota bacterium]